MVDAYPGAPGVSVVVPFHGTRGEAERLLDALAAVDLGPGDEIVVADNTGAGTVPARPGVRVVGADGERSAYHARNEGAAAARGAWLLFVDADCRPRPDVVGRHLATPPGEGVGALVGEVVGEAGQPALVSRYARSRGHLAQHHHWEDPHRPWGVTANLMVRRDAWASVGGFQEGIRSTGDNEFCWRLQEAGWSLEYRPEAVVEHRHRESVRALVRQAARYAAGRAWLARRHPQVIRRPALGAELVRAAAGAAIWTVTGRFERAAFKLLDGLYETVRWTAWTLSNTPPGPPPPRRADDVGVASRFPALDDPAGVRTADALGCIVEAAARPLRVDRAASRRLQVAWAEDDGSLRRWRDALMVAVMAPGPAARLGPARLVELASRARRLRGAGARRLHVLDAGAREDADGLGALLGLEVVR